MLGVGVLVFAATLVGCGPGPRPTAAGPKGSVLAGPAFANTVVGGGLVRVALSPAAPGRNRLTALLASAVEAAKAGGVQPSAGVARLSRMTVSVSLVCDCAAAPVEAAADPGRRRLADRRRPARGRRVAGLAHGRRRHVAGARGAPGGERRRSRRSALRDQFDRRPVGRPPPAAAAPSSSGSSWPSGLVNAKGGVGRPQGGGPGEDDGGDPARARATGRGGPGRPTWPCPAGRRRR